MEIPMVATTMLVLRDGRMLLSGDDGDTKVMRLSCTATPEGAAPSASVSGMEMADGPVWQMHVEASMPQLCVSPDFTLLSEGADAHGEELDMVVCAGMASHTSLRRIRSGLKVHTHIQSEVGQYTGVTGFWAVGSRRHLRRLFQEDLTAGGDSEASDADGEREEMGALLVMAFSNSCRVYTVQNELRDVTDDVGLKVERETLYVGATPAGVLVQVTKEEILFVAPNIAPEGPWSTKEEGFLTTSETPATAVWKAPAGCDVCVATCCRDLVLCSTAGERTVHLIDTTNVGSSSSFSIRGQLLSFGCCTETSSLALISLDDSGSDHGTVLSARGSERWLAVLGLYGDVQSRKSAALRVVLLQVDRLAGTAEATSMEEVDLACYSPGDTAGSVPQSLSTLESPDGQQRLLVGLRNGRVVNFCVEIRALHQDKGQMRFLHEATVRRLAESPVNFVRIRSPNGPALVGLVQDRTLVVEPSRWSMSYERLGLRGAAASHVAPFCCAACPYGLAVLVDTQLRIISLDYSQHLDISTIPLDSAPTALSASLSTCPYPSHAPSAATASFDASVRACGAGEGIASATAPRTNEACDEQRDDLMASRVVWVERHRCLVVACNFTVRTRGASAGAVTACELRLVDMLHEEGQVVGSVFLGLEERVHCLTLARSRSGEQLLCVGTGCEKSQGTRKYPPSGDNDTAAGRTPSSDPMTLETEEADDAARRADSSNDAPPPAPREGGGGEARGGASIRDARSGRGPAPRLMAFRLSAVGRPAGHGDASEEMRADDAGDPPRLSLVLVASVSMKGTCRAVCQHQGYVVAAVADRICAFDLVAGLRGPALEFPPCAVDPFFHLGHGQTTPLEALKANFEGRCLPPCHTGAGATGRAGFAVCASVDGPGRATRTIEPTAHNPRGFRSTLKA